MKPDPLQTTLALMTAYHALYEMPLQSFESRFVIDKTLRALVAVASVTKPRGISWSRSMRRIKSGSNSWRKLWMRFLLNFNRHRPNNIRKTTSHEPDFLFLRYQGPENETWTWHRQFFKTIIHLKWNCWVSERMNICICLFALLQCQCLLPFRQGILFPTFDILDFIKETACFKNDDHHMLLLRHSNRKNSISDTTPLNIFFFSLESIFDIINQPTYRFQHKSGRSQYFHHIEIFVTRSSELVGN